MKTFALFIVMLFNAAVASVNAQSASTGGLATAASTLPSASSGKTSSVTSLNMSNKIGMLVHVEAPEDDIVRVWYSSSDGHVRQKSNALVDATPVDVPLKLSHTSEMVSIKTRDISLGLDPQTLSVNAADTQTGRVLLHNVSFQWTGNGTWQVSYKMRPDEKILGLGQDNVSGGRFDRRGTIRDMWTGQQINSGNVTANYPIPFVISVDSRGNAYGIFIDDVHRMKFDIGATDKDTMTCRSSGGEPDFYIINGPMLAQVVERYTSLTGRPPLPPLWTLGYWQSKCWFWNWDEIDSAYNGLIDRGFPVDVLVIDASWPQKWNDYIWDPRWFADGLTPEQRIAGYAKKGVRIFMSNSGPMVVKDSPTFASGFQAGVFATDDQGNPVEAGYYHGELLDFTAPNMTRWLLPQVAPLIKAGVAGWWLDLSEPEGDSASTVFQGGDDASIHNQFSLLETRWFEEAQLKVRSSQRPWVLTRCASAGIQKYHMSVWTGDTHSDYATLGAHPPEMLNSGLSGLTYWTSDSGGFLSGFYKDDQFGAHAKLYERWMQFSVFSPITRAHHSGPVMPYEYGPDTEKGCLHYIQLRYRLLPYIYSYAWQASQTGLPITRPLVMQYPTDQGSYNAPGDEYLFGTELLVAPVLTEDTTTRDVYFPPGKWFDWDTGEEYDGGAAVTVACPQNRIPVAVKAGSIIPIAPLMSNTGAKPWDPITLLIYPSGTSSFIMYADDGESFNYRHGDCTLTKFENSLSERRDVFLIEESNKLFTPHTYAAVFHLEQRPLAVKIDGNLARQSLSSLDLPTGQWSWEPVNKVLKVSIQAGKQTSHRLVVTLETSAAGFSCTAALPD